MVTGELEEPLKVTWDLTVLLSLRDVDIVMELGRVNTCECNFTQ